MKLLEEMLSTIKSLDARVTKLESDRPHSDSSPNTYHPADEKKLSLKEFLIASKPSNGVQMTLSIAYFLENYEGVSPFNAADLEQAFRTAREPVPVNINDKANMCVKNGHFMEEKAKKDNLKAWVITRTGAEVARKGFSKTTLR